jgi:acyl-CoA synthetase (AMP-forming)/AMP-acid ligase II
MSMQTANDLLAQPFATMPDLVRAHALERPDHPAIIDGAQVVTFSELDAQIDRAAAALQRDGVKSRDTVAICGPSSIAYVTIFVAALRAGAAACPLAPSSTAEQLSMMVRDCGASLAFVDDAASIALDSGTDPAPGIRISLEDQLNTPFAHWLAPKGARPAPLEIDPDQPFNIIYSSGTTGTPKGIVQPHKMRWGHVRRAEALGYDTTAITIVSTPLYSNTTLVSLIPALMRGGTVVLMRKFDARGFLELSQKHRATHAMLVPVQYRRLMDLPDFDTFDLSNYRMKTCTSAPFPADLKADVLKRWPGGLVEIYGMTEGGGSCLLRAHEFPHKLHTVGQPAPGHDVRIIGESGEQLPQGQTGEIVGRSMSIMTGYHNQPGKTAEAEWQSPQGERFIRTGDIGRFDEDGFLVLGDRKKDMIITGGFNVYPSDLEAELAKHPSVTESAVVGVPSREWGETPAAFLVLREGAAETADDIKTWLNARVGKTQRLTYAVVVDSLPRSSIGKVLKRQLRDEFRPTT